MRSSWYTESNSSGGTLKWVGLSKRENKKKEQKKKAYSSYFEAIFDSLIEGLVAFIIVSLYGN